MIVVLCLIFEEPRPIVNVTRCTLHWQPGHKSPLQTHKKGNDLSSTSYAIKYFMLLQSEWTCHCGRQQVPHSEVTLRYCFYCEQEILLALKTGVAFSTKEAIHILFLSSQSAKAGTKIYSLTQCSLTVNEYDWHILAGNDERINSHCLTRCAVFRQTTHANVNTCPVQYAPKWWSPC